MKYTVIEKNKPVTDGADGKSPLKVAAYCRVSLSGEEQASSLESQMSYFSSYIRENIEWSFAGIYFDGGFSGTETKKRAGFNKMLLDAENKHIDLILTKEVSRFARNTLDALLYTRKLLDYGVGVIFINDNIDTRVSDDAFRLTIMASIAEQESRKTSERVKWGQRRRMEQGVVFGNQIFGYIIRDGKITVNPDEAKTVKRIYNEYLYGKKGAHTIAKRLNADSIKPKKSEVWSGNSVLKILKNEKYKGDLLQKKHYTPDFLSHVKKENKGQDDKVLIIDHHEAIVSPVMWENVQAEMERRRKR